MSAALPCHGFSGVLRLACRCGTPPGDLHNGATGGAALHGGAAVSAPRRRWKWKGGRNGGFYDVSMMVLWWFYGGFMVVLW